MTKFQNPVPQLNQLYCYLSDSCNCRCKHCWIAPAYSRDGQGQKAIDVKVFEHVLLQAISLGLQRIKFTGGEPLLHPHIIELIKRVNKHNIRLSMETNGMLMTPKIASEIAKNPQPGVALSLDGVSSQTHDGMRGVKGSFEAVLKAADLLRKNGIRPQFIMTLMRANIDEMENMVDFAHRHHAWSLKFNILQPSNRGENLFRKNENLNISELIELGRWVEDVIFPQSPIDIFFSHPPAFQPLSKIFSKKRGNFCGIRGILGLLADGTYSLCGVGAFIDNLTMGNAKSHSLEDVWRNNPVLNDVRRNLPAKLEGICAECVMNTRCLGSCIAQNHISGGSLWAPYWYCAQADKLGLFPENRKILKRQIQQA